ncbi:unnamed protein product [Soboliphyme baturini]|uniref:Phage tail protein n=1 Tax=Soboliphyme baturini TaxID=241478 RepID=A0A183IIQ8_9BILA|nr:unnamed protein product [Soboliphyme baturini]
MGRHYRLPRGLYLNVSYPIFTLTQETCACFYVVKSCTVVNCRAVDISLLNNSEGINDLFHLRSSQTNYAVVAQMGSASTLGAVLGSDSDQASRFSLRINGSWSSSEIYHVRTHAMRAF